MEAIIIGGNAKIIIAGGIKIITGSNTAITAICK